MIRSWHASRRRAPARSSITHTSTSRCSSSRVSPARSSCSSRDARWTPRRITRSSSPRPRQWEDELHSVLLNGELPAPRTLVVRAGVAHRLRFINMTLRSPGARIQLWRDTYHEHVATTREGRRRSPCEHRRIDRPARAIISIGETMDYEFLPTRGGNWRIEVSAANGNVLATMPLEVNGLPQDSSGIRR